MEHTGKGMSVGLHPADARRASTAPPSPSSSSATSSAAGSGAAPGGATGEATSPEASPGRRRKRGSPSLARAVASPAPAPSPPAAAAVPAPAPARTPAVRGHKTVKLRPQVYEVPTLGYLCVQLLAEHSDSIVDLRGVGEDTARQLLREIIDRQKLTYPLARVFMDCGDDELSSAVGALNLWDAIPTGRQGRHSRHL